MDSNLSRLYLMLGNGEGVDDDEQEALQPQVQVPLEDSTVSATLTTTVSGKTRKRPKGKGAAASSSNTESDTLLLNGAGARQMASNLTGGQVVVVDLPPPRPKNTSHSIFQPPSSFDAPLAPSGGVSASVTMLSQLMDSPTAATLDISSSTTILPGSHVSSHQGPSSSTSGSVQLSVGSKGHNRQSGTPSLEAPSKLPPPNTSSNANKANRLPKQPSVELHFNPLYTISDGGGDHHQQHQPSPAAHRNANSIPDSVSPSANLPNLSFRFPNFTTTQPQPPHHPSANQHLLFFGQPPPPTDRYGLIYLALLLAGIGFLLPYNSFVIASDYFQHRFPGTTIVFDMSTTYIIVAFWTVTISNLVVELMPLFWRLNLGYLLSLGIMAIVAVYEIWAKLGGYLPNLVLIGIASVGCTLQQSTFYGYTSMLPKKYTQAVMTGESAAGIFVSFNRILTKALYPADEQFNTALFFFISILVILFCAFIHIILLPRSAFIRHYILLCNSTTASGTAPAGTEVIRHRTRRRRSHSKGSDSGGEAGGQGSSPAARMMHQINENLGLVQMYNQRSQQQQNSENLDLPRPSIYSTSSSHLDAIEVNPSGSFSGFRAHSSNSANDTKVASILRTDSMECVLPFGIDDEELAVTEREALAEEQAELSGLHNVPLNHQDSLGEQSAAGDFKSKSATSAFVTFVVWLENFLHVFRAIRLICRRIRQYDHNFSSDHNFEHHTTTLRRKLLIRQAIIIRIWPHILTIILVYFVTLLIIPGIESEIYSCYFHEWMPIILMAVFNLTDFTGKLLSTCFYRITGTQLMTVALLRILLVPAMTLCVTPRMDPFFGNPLWPILFTVILGLTNGIFGSLPMILAPIRVHENMREITGNLMTFSYLVGVTTGSILSYELHAWINDHSPNLPSSGNYSYATFAENCSAFGSGAYGPSLFEGDFDRNAALLQSLGNMSDFNASVVLSDVAPELIQNGSVFSSSIYHF